MTTSAKAICIFVALLLCFIQSDAAVFVMEGTIGQPVEISLGETAEPYVWGRTVTVNNVESKQYLFPCACNNGSWTDGTRYYGSGAVATWDGKLKIARYSTADEGSYFALNEKVPPNVAQSMGTLITKQNAPPGK